MSINWADFYHSLHTLNSAQSPLASGPILAELQANIGSDKLLVCITNPSQDIQLYYGVGFSPEDYQFHQNHLSDNLYLQTYLTNNLMGTSVCLQKMLPEADTVSPEFMETFWPKINTDYMYALIIPLGTSWQLRLSCYRKEHAFPEDFAHHLNALGAGLISWAIKICQFHDKIFRNAVNSISTEHLTPAESQVLHLLSDGMDGSEIAHYRNVSKETVKSQIKSLLHKTHCRHQNELLSRLLELTDYPSIIS